MKYSLISFSLSISKDLDFKLCWNNTNIGGNKKSIKEIWVTRLQKLDGGKKSNSVSDPYLSLWTVRSGKEYIY